MNSVLIVGSAGMLGFSLLRHIAADGRFRVHATVRDGQPRRGFTTPPSATLHPGCDALSDDLHKLIRELKPQFVINCVGVIKQLQGAESTISMIELNALVPHRLAAACSEVEARMIHFSTDCVFDGERGGYKETDRADADDLYGRSKRLGEVSGGGHLTLRTSLIGHELRRGVSLVDWFLGQAGPVRGYRQAIFSGFPTVSIARFLLDHVLAGPELEGLYHLASTPIDKFTLLSMIASAYGHQIEIIPVDAPAIDRSLDGRMLKQVTGFRAPPWEQLIGEMHQDYAQSYQPWRNQP